MTQNRFLQMKVWAPQDGAVGGVSQAAATQSRPLAPPTAAQAQSSDQGNEGGIVQIVPHLENGPIGRFTADLALTVNRLGGESCMISAGGRFAQEVVRANVLHESIDVTKAGGLGFAAPSAQVATQLKKWNARLVHSHGAVCASQTAKAIAKRPIQHIASMYRLPETDNGKDLKTRSLLAADHIIVASEFLRQKLVGFQPDAADKISVIPPGMAINAVHPSVVTAARLTRLVKKIDIRTDAPVILFPAAVLENAGHSLMLDVLEQLTDAPWACIFATIGVGNRRIRTQLQNRIDAMGFQNRIRFVDNCDDPATLYKLSAVVVSSVMGNLAFDYAAAEAQSAGKIVLVPNSGASQFQVEAGKDGAIFETGDAETLGMALSWALSLPADVRASIEHAATAVAYKTYKRDEAVKRVFSVYDSLLS